MTAVVRWCLCGRGERREPAQVVVQFVALTYQERAD